MLVAGCLRVRDAGCTFGFGRRQVGSAGRAGSHKPNDSVHRRETSVCNDELGKYACVLFSHTSREWIRYRELIAELIFAISRYFAAPERPSKTI